MNIDIIDIDTVDATTVRIDGVEFAKADCSVSAYGDQHALIAAGGQMFIASHGSSVNGYRPRGQTALLYAINSLLEGVAGESESVKSFGGVGDGVTDDTDAILAAHATGKIIRYPHGDYICNASIPLDQGGMVGDGWGASGSALKSRILFGGGLAAERGAVVTKLSTRKSYRPIIKDMMLKAASWDEATGARCNGLDIEAPIQIENVVTEGFYKYGAYFHNNEAGSGPYESYIMGLRALYNRQHGIVVGTGANVLTFVNTEAKWNGAPSYGTAPSVAGVYDGFHVATNDAGNPDGTYHVHTPESLTIIGGDASYNSRYGWNFESLTNSTSIFPGYAELNLDAGAKQVRIGTEVSKALIAFAKLSGGLTDIQNDHAWAAAQRTVRVLAGGRPLLFTGNNIYDYAADTDVVNKFVLSDQASASTFLMSNETPDALALAASGVSAVTTLRGGGSYAIGIGSGSRHLKVLHNEVRLPDLYTRGISTGWAATTVTRAIATAMPTTGTFKQGDYYENRTPTILGAASSRYVVLGWLRITTGSNNVLNTDWVECRCLTGA